VKFHTIYQYHPVSIKIILFHSFLLPNKKVHFGLQKFFPGFGHFINVQFSLCKFSSQNRVFLDFYKMSVFKLLLIMVSFSEVINRFIFMQSKRVYYKTSLFGDIIIRLIFRDFCDLLAYTGW
jgi:hypothetical protein